jgi:hypothetical protein
MTPTVRTIVRAVPAVAVLALASACAPAESPQCGETLYPNGHAAPFYCASPSHLPALLAVIGAVVAVILASVAIGYVAHRRRAVRAVPEPVASQPRAVEVPAPGPALELEPEPEPEPWTWRAEEDRKAPAAVTAHTRPSITPIRKAIER